MMLHEVIPLRRSADSQARAEQFGEAARQRARRAVRDEAGVLAISTHRLLPGEPLKRLAGPPRPTLHQALPTKAGLDPEHPLLGPHPTD